MIGRLKGVLLEKQPPVALIDVQGISYEVFFPENSFLQMPSVGSEIICHTHFIVREDAQCLYGFLRRAQRSLFRLLIKVNGVGPKLALAILSGIDPALFVRSVQAQDTRALVALPGVGKKMAERLVVELKRPLGAESGFSFESSDSTDATLGVLEQDAVEALVALGYKPLLAAQMVRRVSDQADTREALIRLALKAH